ncbi:MAG: recombinase family protein [Pseudomonadota bacterium]|nr:recombinase family protein [Pseudomonadota bacterium]
MPHTQESYPPQKPETKINNKNPKPGRWIRAKNQAIIVKAMQAFAEFERALRKERQSEGIALAKQRGVYTGRTRILTQAQTTEIRRRASGGESKTPLAREFGVNRSTIYEHLASN